jgi:tetratricopeptide (TPR) repeat protein
MFPALLLAAVFHMSGLAAADGVPDAPRDLDTLYAHLATADADAAPAIAEEIAGVLSESGSAAMDLLLGRGRTALADDPEAALGHLTALVDHAPDFAEGYSARATALYRLGDFGEAIDDLHRALDIEPRHFGALTGLAVIMEELGYDAAALKAWREVRSLYPAQPQAEDGVRRLEVVVDGITI